MNKKQIKKELKRGLILGSIYLLISIPLAFLLMKVIELKYTKIFWSYFAIMGISAIIADFNDMEPEDQKTNFIKIVEHIAFITFITLIILPLYFL